MTDEPHDPSGIRSIDAIAVRKTPEGRLPSRAEVLHEISENTPNLLCAGDEGLEALGLLVERARIIEWNEALPHSMIEHLAERLLVMAG